MNGNKNQSDIGMGLVFICVAIAFIAIFIYVAVVFVATVLSVMALIALLHPLHLGRYTLDAPEARAFLLRGMAGALILPGFVMLAEIVVGIRIRPNFWVHVMIIGYCLGAIGSEIWLALQRDVEPQQPATQLLISPETPAQNTNVGLSQVSASTVPRQSEPEPFRFATWDDEEELRK